MRRRKPAAATGLKKVKKKQLTLAAVTRIKKLKKKRLALVAVIRTKKQKKNQLTLVAVIRIKTLKKKQAALAAATATIIPLKKKNQTCHTGRAAAAAMLRHARIPFGASTKTK